MNNFFSRRLNKFIIILILVIIIFNSIFPTNSFALYEEIGGTLFEPIKDLVCGLGDVIINIMQDIMMPDSPTAIDKRSLADLAVEDAWKERRIR